ncbi:MULTISPECIES: aminotransferase class I/II-fold pyridoxal phosphate-dependent enzyme [Chryseobacterium]|uniref:dTDP-4-amino-4,6-dideoxygalactose transaminase n=1 Tax=Chryseobacterium camelliae TaxID=1265445 RepID=A0ABU0TG75_9FLAO|nr:MULTISPECIES: aminotransferase class I/II-fold pyridoxal phosphate-dependent enzyme [Chryseobacterium]MDT3407076.1 dTDP-4-amino-4,6-dideoxygalactose transaminase [Pseudacidovorax intermedius]MDQ1095133.1 dTDP-4-amino-4,6-dideoxygalactose transaminase [Chryseobacterium camelliae]MDQ1099070.1 dTDP-4-amino-4,6-dideoxygalactose transaminase [Chryseobacterium sp. SORGH_AS_1048]MDR6086420.1 dTDP-4-amino-4,6-dideoxygalactose transaminase [Chryseobacterium sp. SORGH_AS_0909]MDR6130792.1 dTDP-4-amin
MKKKIWLSSPHLSGHEMQYIQEAFDENWITSIGKNIDEFEYSLAQYMEMDNHIVALNSATSAIHIALILLGTNSQDEIITSSFSFVASANPIIYCGATPIFIDSEEDTWNMCPIALEQAIKDRISKGKKPKAIIVVHLYGMPAKMDEILKIAEEYEITVIEDAAEALGSSYKGKSCGTFGRFGILSFNGNKIITTSGGGALVCHTQEDKDKAVFLSTQARDPAPHYQHSHIGYNYRMSNIVAGIGRGQMEVLKDRIEARRKMHDFYISLFKDIKGIKVFSEPTDEYYSNHWLSAIIIDPEIAGKTREELRMALLEENIESRPLWKPMHLQPVFSTSPYYETDVSEKLFENGLCLPSGSNLTESDKKRITDVIVDFFSDH